VEDYGKDLYKLMKVFMNRYKKQMAQRDERERERKKSVRRRSTIVGSNDPAVVALRKSEQPVTPPAAISVCEKVIAHLTDFKVYFLLSLGHYHKMQSVVTDVLWSVCVPVFAGHD